MILLESTVKLASAWNFKTDYQGRVIITNRLERGILRSTTGIGIEV